MERASALRRVPPWIWLGALVVTSFVARALLARDMVGPFIMVDELIYSELGRSLADSGELLIRDVPSPGYGIVYPALISPAYALFEGLPDAYAAVKTLNALVMSLAAVPAYLLARRVVGPWLSLLAALLAVAIPSLVYTGTVMTENVFYPVFLAVALLFVLTLEKPTAARQLLLLGAVAVAFATRAQAVALVPALLTAPLVLALFRGESIRAVAGASAGSTASLSVGALVGVAVQLARGRSLADLFGAYGVVGDSEYDLVEVLRFFVYHVAELDLYLGIVPVAATIVLAARARSLDPPLQALLAVALSRQLLADPRRLGVRVGVRAADPGAEPVRRRAALPRPPAGVGRARSRPSAGRDVDRRRASRPGSCSRSRSSASSRPPRSRTPSCCCRGGTCRITSRSSG